jgi:predicted transcriptional regulator
MKMENKVIETINKAGKALRPGDIADLSGLNKQEVEKAIKKLKAENKIFSPVRCFYDIKK